MPRIRPYRPGDLAGVSAVCLRTGHAGGDARPFYRDQELLPDVFARPYLVREPELATVVEEGDAVVGYVLGTMDTAGFAGWARDVWLPPLATRHPLPAAGGAGWDDVMTRALHRPERMVRPELAAYPAHLHINLLEAYQRKGLGTRLIRTFVAALRARGVPGVHLAYAKTNIPARRFYRRQGFTPLAVDDPDPVRYVCRATG